MNAAQYTIQTLEDFMDVPDDRLDDCLKEFADAIRNGVAVREMVKICGEITGDKNATSRFGAFTWIDDGKKDRTIILQATPPR